MRVELKQWLRSHWGEMTANERAKFPEQTLYLSPGGAGITSMREEYEHWLQILMMVSGFVLLIVCANVANLMLVRGMERRRQTSLSMALGARASRLVRQALTESILLSLLGGAAGLAIAFAGTRLILHFAFPTLPGHGRHADQRVAFHAGAAVRLWVSLIAGVAFGIAPAWMATRVDPIEALARSRAGPRLARLALAEDAGGVAGRAVAGVAIGVGTAHRRSAADLETSGFRIRSGSAHRGEHRSEAGRLPAGATHAAVPAHPRLAVEHSRRIGSGSLHVLAARRRQLGRRRLGGWTSGSRTQRRQLRLLGIASRAGYFDVIGNPILRGRGISEQDTATSRHVAVINEAFARKFFKNEDPIGKHFGQHGNRIRARIRDCRHCQRCPLFDFRLDKPVGPFFFLPEAQHDVLPKPDRLTAIAGSHFLHDIVIVTRPGASLSVAQVRQAMASVDPNLPVISIRTLREQVAGQFSQQRLIARLTSFFGILSLILASIGLYGVTAYNAGRRVNEIGVRMALGAGRGARCRAGAPRRIRADCRWTIDRVAVDVCRGAIPGPSALRHEPIRPSGDFSLRPGARTLSPACVTHSCFPGKSDFAIRSVARRITLSHITRVSQ